MTPLLSSPGRKTKQDKKTQDFYLSEVAFDSIHSKGHLKLCHREAEK